MFVFLYADSGCGCIVFAFFLPIEKGEKQSGDVRLPEISVAYPAVDSVVLIKSYPGYLTSLQNRRSGGSCKRISATGGLYAG